jgi:PilZ domain
MGERRGSRRQKSFLRGCIYFDRRRGAMDCLIRDLSDEGARIIFSDAVNVPDSVDLYIPHKEQTLRARVKWRRGDEVGLAFAEANPVAASSPQESELTQRIAQLEGEIAALQRSLKKLKRERSGNSEIDAA